MRRKTQLLAHATIALLVAAVALAPTGALAAALALDLKVERKPVTLLQGEPAHAAALIRDMTRRTVGRTESTVRTATPILYHFSTVEDDGRHRLDADSLELAEPARLSARITIRSPRLSDAQYKALRASPDYKLVYGFIRGIVEHEELHAREFARFARAVRAIYAAPPVGENPTVAPREEETVSAAVARYVQDRISEALRDARRASTAVQDRIDRTGKTTRVRFSFTDPLDGDPPPDLVYETKGKLRVSFTVPERTPRPPEPKTKY